AWWPTAGHPPVDPRSGWPFRRRLVAQIYERLPAYSPFAANLREAGDAPPLPAEGSRDPKDLGLLLALLALVLALALGLLWWLARRLFLLDADAHGTSDIPASGTRSVWVLGWPPEGSAAPVESETPGATVFDLRHAATLASLGTAADRERAADRLLEIDHLEIRLGDPVWERRMFALVEHVAKHEDRRIILTSDTDPIRHLSSRLVEEGPPSANGPAGGGGDGLPGRLAHWARMLDSFSVVRHDVADGSTDPV